jgi:large subunit ribosomal protein L14e
MEVAPVDELVGRLVLSKAGRDRGKPFVILKVINDRFVILADGDLRKVDNAKLKNIKHLQVTNSRLDEVRETLARGEVPENHRLRKLLRSLWADYQEENREGGSL